MRFHILTLGCPKNEVDSEGMEVMLAEAGHSPVDGFSEADLVIVNTCGFIDAARKESMDALKRLSAKRKPGSLLVAAGCLAQREGQGLAGQVKGVDAVIGCRSWPEIVRLAEMLELRSASRAEAAPALLGADLQLGEFKRRARGGSSYVKISDGCDATCAFCAIPSIKGKQRSKPEEQVVEEVRQLAEGGVKEVVLVGQDTTAYGLDLGYRDGLPRLLYRIAEEVPGLPWIRVLYLYPQRMTPALLRAMAELPQLCKYADIPLQHTHPDLLRRMGRPHDEVKKVVDSIRQAIPEVAIRTTFIVGFPGETEEEHQQLLATIQELRFDHVGVFTYSPQVGTAAAAMDGQIPEAVKERRWRETMELAQRISLEQNRRLVGREMEVLVEGVGRSGRRHQRAVAGRSYRDAPEVDGLVLFNGEARVGDLVRVRITSALEYDLVGEPVGGEGLGRERQAARGRRKERAWRG